MLLMLLMTPLLLMLLLGGGPAFARGSELPTTANLTLYYDAAAGGGPLLVARDAIGAAVAHVEATERGKEPPEDGGGGGALQQIVVEVNTLWAPFAEARLFPLCQSFAHTTLTNSPCRSTARSPMARSSAPRGAAGSRRCAGR